MSLQYAVFMLLGIHFPHSLNACHCGLEEEYWREERGLGKEVCRRGTWPRSQTELESLGLFRLRRRESASCCMAVSEGGSFRSQSDPAARTQAVLDPVRAFPLSHLSLKTYTEAGGLPHLVSFR